MANVDPLGVDLSTGKARSFKSTDTLTDDLGNPLLTQGATGSGIQGVTGLIGSTGLSGTSGATGLGTGGDTLFIPSSVTNGQTAFVLSPTPTNAISVIMFINGGAYFAPTYFTVSGANVTWLNAFALVSTDAVSFRYT
jgi:uncharacterized membrane protein